MKSEWHVNTINLGQDRASVHPKVFDYAYIPPPEPYTLKRLFFGVDHTPGACNVKIQNVTDISNANFPKAWCAIGRQFNLTGAG